MARRPTSERILSRSELADFTRHLTKLDRHGVEKIYEGAWHDRRLQDGWIPTAVAIQQLVNDLENASTASSEVRIFPA